METRGTFIDLDMTTKITITFELDKDTDLSSIDALLNKDLDIIAKPHKEKRSLDANAYFHVLVNQLARALNTPDDEMKIKMNTTYGTMAVKDGTICGVIVPKNTDISAFYPYAKFIGEKEDNGKVFDKYIFYKRTSELNTAEMSKLIDGVVEECKEVGIETLPPQELESMKRSWSV